MLKFFTGLFFKTTRAPLPSFAETPIECPNCRGHLSQCGDEYVCRGFYSKMDVSQRLSPHWPEGLAEAVLKRLPDRVEDFNKLRVTCEQAQCEAWKKGNNCSEHGSYGPCGFVGKTRDYKRRWG